MNTLLLSIVRLQVDASKLTNKKKSITAKAKIHNCNSINVMYVHKRVTKIKLIAVLSSSRCCTKP